MVLNTSVLSNRNYAVVAKLVDATGLSPVGNYLMRVQIPPTAFLVIKGLCMWVVYLLRCSDNSLYCGITNDMDGRLKAHQAGKGAKYTRSRLPVKVVHIEVVGSKSTALKREIVIKKLSKKEKEVMVKHILMVKKVKICPECGSHKIELFDADNDICRKCGKWFTGS